MFAIVCAGREQGMIRSAQWLVTSIFVEGRVPAMAEIAQAAGCNCDTAEGEALLDRTA